MLPDLNLPALPPSPEPAAPVVEIQQFPIGIFSRSRKGGVSNIIDRLTWEEVKEVVDLNSVQLFNIFPGDRNPLQLLSTFPREILSAEQQAALRDR